MEIRNKDSPVVYICSPYSGDVERNTEMARRDLGLEDCEPEDYTELSARMEDYLDEFDKNGLGSINIDIDN